jgi:hypothetical protein
VRHRHFALTSAALSCFLAISTVALSQLVDPVPALAGPPSGALGPSDFQTAYHLPKWNSGSLPASLYGADTVAADGYVFVIGGNNGSGPVGTVYSAQVTASGSVGTWSSTAPLPAALYQAAAVAYGGYIFVTGGNNGTSAVTTVYSGQVSIGKWQCRDGCGGDRLRRKRPKWTSRV